MNPSQPSLISRRDAIRNVLLGAAGIGFAADSTLRAQVEAPILQPLGAAKSIIQIWMWGGPAHLDTFDPKPEAGNDYCGPYKNPISTNVDGVHICEMLPLLAQQADKYTIIRSMTHNSNAHETATYIAQTGHSPGGRLVYPCASSVISLFKGASAGDNVQLPSYIALTEPLGRTSECGFLGGKYKPFVTGGDPARTPFEVEGIVAPGITEQQQRQRRQWLADLNTLKHAASSTPAMKTLTAVENEAYDMILGGGAKVFDLSTEDEALREAYGKNKFGQSCLVARRLIEQGVPVITINYAGWDTHKNHFQSMRNMLPELDQGMATLLKDLSERGMLDSTIVWWGGEFGRTPKIQWEAPYNGGRGHWGSAYSAVVAGGGFRGGHIIGRTDPRGETVVENPVSPAELIACIYNRMGIAPDAQLPLPDGSGVPAAASINNQLLQEIIV
jgi:hypothetical protein